MTQSKKRWLGFEMKPTHTDARIEWASPLGPPAPESFVMIRHHLLVNSFEAFFVFSRTACPGGLKLESGSCSSERTARKKVELQLKTLYRVTGNAAEHLSKAVKRALV